MFYEKRYLVKKESQKREEEIQLYHLQANNWQVLVFSPYLIPRRFTNKGLATDLKRLRWNRLLFNNKSLLFSGSHFHMIRQPYWNAPYTCYTAGTHGYSYHDNSSLSVASGKLHSYYVFYREELIWNINLLASPN